MKVMFLDESGDHKLTRIYHRYPIFVLGGAIVERAYIRDVIEPEMNQFKRRYFGRDDVVLHTVNMRNGTGDYAFLADPNIRADFYRDLNSLLQRWDYNVVACAIKKDRYVAQYTNPVDPYMYSLDILVERFCWELDTQLDGGFICAEKRGDRLDRDLMLAWETLRTTGTEYASASRIDCRIVGMDLRDKKPNLAGLQLADLIVTPIGRYVMGQAPRPYEVQWSVVESKLRRGGSGYLGRGLVVRP